MKENQKFRKLLDLKKIDIAILKDSEKSRIYGGDQTYDGGETCWCSYTFPQCPGETLYCPTDGCTAGCNQESIDTLNCGATCFACGTTYIGGCNVTDTCGTQGYCS